MIAGVLLAASVGLHDIGTIRAGSPAIQVGDGNDHMNYAQIADWVLTHRAPFLQKEPADSVYERIPRAELLESTRPGSYFLLAFAATLRGTSGLFAYDLACAIAWAAAILGVAAAIARTPGTLLVLTIALMTAGWYDYARNGFFGKLMSYPAALMLVGIAVTVRPTPTRIFSLLLITVAVSTLHAGTVIALIVGSIGAVFLLAEFVRTRRPPVLHAYLIAGIFAAAVATTGSLVRLKRLPYPDWNLDWPYIVTRVLDLKMQAGLPNDTADRIAYPLAALSVGICLVVAVIAWRRGRSDALAFAIAPLLLLAALALARANAAAFQLIAFAYPASLCAIAFLLNEGDGYARWRILVASLAVLYVGIHVPRFRVAVDRFATAAPPSRNFSVAHFDEAVRQLKGQPVVVDTDNTISSFVMRAELMRRKLPLQWTDRGWRTAGLYHFESGRAPPPFDPLLMRITDTPPPKWRVVYAAPGFNLIAPE